jgi:bifunctional DNA-binding transcriptional regulator/antitoxin component of YhaV-PrlF toxin-antitoxin module
MAAGESCAGFTNKWHRLIPAALRRSLGLGEGDTLVARQEQGKLVLEKPSAIKQHLWARFAGLPAERQLVYELLAERRLQALPSAGAFAREASGGCSRSSL